jgi:hypothetical protein
MTTPNISTNPETGVRYYDEPGHPLNEQSVDLFVTMRGDTVINAGGIRWPYINGLPIPDPDLRFYLKGEPRVRTHDPRAFIEVASWGPVDYANPREGGPAGTWEETLTEQLRPLDELLNQVEAERLQANARLYPSSEDPMLGVLLAEAIRRDSEDTATPVMRDLLSRHQGLVNAGFNNMERAIELKAQILAGGAFDLSAGWDNGL